MRRLRETQASEIPSNRRDFASFPDVSSRENILWLIHISHHRMPPAKKVVSVGANPELLWLRHAVLKSAGFRVHTTESEKDATEVMQNGDCGVLLLCYSLAFEARKRLAENFKRYCPTSRIVAITNERLEEPDFAHAFVYGFEGPEVLIDALRRE